MFDVLLPKMAVISLVVAVLGLVAKASLVKGGDIMLLVGLSTLSIVYVLRAFERTKLTGTDEVNFPKKYLGQGRTKFAATSKEISFFSDLILPKIVWLSGSVVIIGLLFKLMNWKGANQQLFNGVIGEVIVIICLAFNQRMNLRALILGVIGGFMLFVSPKYLAQQFHRDDPVLVQKMIYQLDHPRDRAAAEDVRQYLKQKRAQR